MKKRCETCDVELGEFNGHNNIFWPVSKRRQEVCNHCAENLRTKKIGEIATSDGHIFRYIYLSHSKVVSFSYENGSDAGNYDFKVRSICWCRGTEPSKYLQEIADKYLEMMNEPPR